LSSQFDNPYRFKFGGHYDRGNAAGGHWDGPHKRSVRIEIMTSGEVIVDKGRFGTDPEGHDAMRRHVKAWHNRVWATRAAKEPSIRVEPRDVM